jgi:hypothetical protein
VPAERFRKLGYAQKRDRFDRDEETVSPYDDGSKMEKYDYGVPLDRSVIGSQKLYLRESQDLLVPLTLLMECQRRLMAARETLLQLSMLRRSLFQHVTLTMGAKPRLPLLL